VKIAGSSLWSINKAIDLINTSLLSEIDFLYKDIFQILTNHYKDPKKEAKFKKQFEMFFKSILSGMLTKASKKLTKKKIPNG
jgi:ribosomal protein L13